MPIVQIQDPITRSSARIAPDLGFNCFELIVREQDAADISVLDRADGFEGGGFPPSHSGIPLLFPFPNRIRSGKYSWDGRNYELPEALVGYEGSGNAIHGFCLDRAWRVTEQSGNSVTAVFQFSRDAPERRPLWPADAELQVTYSLYGGCLRSDFVVRNPDSKPLPWGLGTHAYFRLPLSRQSTADQCTISAPAEKRWELDNCLPTGRIIDSPKGAHLPESPAYGNLKLDDVYTNVLAEDGIVTCRIVDKLAGIQVIQRCEESFRELVAFTPPWTTAVCVEPYTCTTDAINLQQQGVDAGLKVLGPGESWTGWIEIEAGSCRC